MSERKMKALIDGDILLYKLGFGSQDVAGNPIRNIQSVLKMVDTTITNILVGSNSNDFTIFLTGEQNFREQLYSEYKANRKNVKRPYYYQVIKDHFINAYYATVIHGIEADDAMGLAQDDDTIIVSIDKDMKTIPGWHMNLETFQKSQITDYNALVNFYEQIITGDRTDNIPGLYHITGQKVTESVKRHWYQFVNHERPEMELRNYVASLFLNSIKTTMKYQTPYGFVLTKGWDACPPSDEDIIHDMSITGELLWIQRKNRLKWLPVPEIE